MRATEGSKPARNVVSYQRLQPGPYESGLLFNSRDAPGLFNEIVIYIQCTSHMHKYAFVMHIMSMNRNRHSGLTYCTNDRQQNRLNPRREKFGWYADVDLHKTRKTWRGASIKHFGRVAADLHAD